MAKGDSSSSGLLSKMAKFVRNPTRDWSELDQKEEPAADSGFNKEMLRQMIERKRQNDFVRKREFDYLRKLRRRESLNGPGQTGRPSFFQSSLPTNPDERALTLRKIDEIEAQMSRQWWQGKQDDSAARAAGFPVTTRPALGPDAGPTQPMPQEGEIGDSNFASTQSSGLQTSSNWIEVPEEYALTRMDPADVGSALPPSSLRSPLGGERAVPPGSGFSNSRQSTSELVDNLTDPDLEEAAIRYANGDTAGAEATLLAALQTASPRPELAQAWMGALFDIYRATGQQARFDSVALDFARRFERSPPAWFSIPEQLGRQPASPADGAADSGDASAWSCPAVLDAEAVAALESATLGGAGRRLVDWGALQAVTPAAVPGLAHLFACWCSTPVHLAFLHHEALMHVLKQLTPAADRSAGPLAWQLRLDALRILQEQEEFELVALDYCVTFEVSPPSWQEARCRCDCEGTAARAGAAVVRQDEAAGRAQAAAGAMELAGEILGDASDLLAGFEAGMEDARRLAISCARLIRVDFSAAGSILNWVVAQQAQGRQVHFLDVNRIVAAFFRVIGINEHARIVPRST
jgi:ABC-type transporter Mla MlaB component